MCAFYQVLWGCFMLLLARQSLLLPGIAVYWLAGLTAQSNDSPHMTLLNQQIPAAQRSAMLSMASMVGYLGVMLGSFGFAALAERFCIQTVWLLDGLVLIVSSLLYIKVERVRKSVDPAKQVLSKEEANV